MTPRAPTSKQAPPSAAAQRKSKKPERSELPDLLSVRDVAQWLRKSAKAVRTMRERGQLPPPINHPSLRTLLWRRSDLANWFLQAESRRTGPRHE